MDYERQLCFRRDYSMPFSITGGLAQSIENKRKKKMTFLKKAFDHMSPQSARQQAKQAFRSIVRRL
jgi:hypothetical protein